jgi:hypothetical protein
MANTNFLPSRLDIAFSRLAFPESLKTLIAMQGNPAYCAWYDDFLGDEVDTKYPANGGTGTQVVGITAAVGGTLTIASQGNQATDSGIQTGPGLHWNGDLGFYFIARAKISSLATVKFSLGVTDEQTDTGPINSKASATFNVSDLAVFSFDTADDTNLTLQTNGGTTDLNVDTTFTMVADTYTIFEIKAQDNHVSFYVNGRYVGGGAEVIEGGVAMMPVFYIEQNDTAARTMTVDWMGIVGPRS